jgi:hypothetical protein
LVRNEETNYVAKGNKRAKDFSPLREIGWEVGVFYQTIHATNMKEPFPITKNPIRDGQT